MPLVLGHEIPDLPSLLTQGTPMICARDFVPRQIAGWIKQHRATVLPTGEGLAMGVRV